MADRHERTAASSARKVPKSSAGAAVRGSSTASAGSMKKSRGAAKLANVRSRVAMTRYSAMNAATHPRIAGHAAGTYDTALQITNVSSTAPPPIACSQAWRRTTAMNANPAATRKRKPKSV